MGWHKVIEVEELPEPGGRSIVRLEGKELTILNTPDGIYCIDYRCPHTGGPLGDGRIVGGSIVCPLHRWKIDLSDGSHPHLGKAPPAGVYQLKLEGNSILVEI